MDAAAFFAAVERDTSLPEPPAERNYVGAGDYRAIGCGVARSLVETAGLGRGDCVLEAGSGIGRVAVPLTQWLTEPGARYVGVEVVEHGVAWCRENVTARWPRFTFVHADLHNNFYNPTATLKTRDLPLPLPPGSADVAVFASVFTHLDAEDADAWLGLAARALRPGGQVWSTWFILDQAAREATRAGAAAIGFGHAEAGVHWQTAERNAGAVGYAPERMAALFEANRLRPVFQELGTWCKRAPADGVRVGGGFQDLVMLRRD